MPLSPSPNSSPPSQTLNARIPATFALQKSKILQSLGLAADADADAEGIVDADTEAKPSDRSPKGSIDAQIRPLLARLNALPGVVTTSSCSGRISVFLEGKRGKGGEKGEKSEKSEKGAASLPVRMTNGAVNGGDGGFSDSALDEEEEVEDEDQDKDDEEEKDGAKQNHKRSSGKGKGKGKGGKWLFVSHEPLDPSLVETGNGNGGWKRVLGLERQRVQGIDRENGVRVGMGRKEWCNLDLQTTRFIRFQFESMVRSYAIHLLLPPLLHPFLSLGVKGAKQGEEKHLFASQAHTPLTDPAYPNSLPLARTHHPRSRSERRLPRKRPGKPDLSVRSRASIPRRGSPESGVGGGGCCGVCA